MPPQGESTGLAIEDGVLLARILTNHNTSVQEAFLAYENTRRSRINSAYKEAVMRWGNMKDRSWLMQKVMEWLMWAILWYKLEAFESSMSYDIRKEPVVN
jgi:2-polyprenyl-6-methoxyphenol hydroxylase-like FAD-dependent oxidoreductase